MATEDKKKNSAIEYFGGMLGGAAKKVSERDKQIAAQEAAALGETPKPKDKEEETKRPPMSRKWYE